MRFPIIESVETPLFPLHTVLFPGSVLPLQVFEPRYRAMLDDVMRSDRRFAVVAIRRGLEVGGPAETYEIGCLAEVTKLQRAPDGTAQLLVEGRARVAIERRLPDDPYPIGMASLLPEPDGEYAAEAIAPARAALRRYLAVVAQIEGTDVTVPSIPDEAVAASHAIAGALRVEIADLQALLECRTAADRLALARRIARREALLLEAIGPNVDAPRARISLN